jgi:hypothetical protein
VIQLQVTVGMSINHHPGDQIPVLFKDEVIGRVLEVRAVYVLDGIEYTQVTVEVEDHVVGKATAVYGETLQPPFGIFFPRTPNDIDHIFKVS